MLIFVIFYLIGLINSYPYFPECSKFNSDALVLNTLNGKIIGKCYNVTVNYGSKPQSTNQVLTWLGNFIENKLLLYYKRDV